MNKKQELILMYQDEEELNRILYKFFNGRAIAEIRRDYDSIIKATSCKDSFELSFKGHGLSLSNHYWYRETLLEPYDALCILVCVFW